MYPDDDDEPSFFQANKTWIVLVAVVALGAGGYFGFLHKGEKKAAPAPERITMVQLPPPPPPKPKPVPTPPPAEKPPEPQKVETKERMEDAPKTDAPPKPEPAKAPDDPPPSMGSNIKGDGNDGFGLSGSGNGGFVGLGGTGRGGGGSAYSRYGAQIQSRLAEALRQDRRTRTATFNGKIRLWLDTSGRVTRAEAASRGDSGTELAASVMVGQRVFDQLPSGMPMPVTVHPSASRPR
jgi:periplasmic protein TonB